jgi:RNA polymerase sigma-70 factor (ECF subfamily)
MATGNLLINPEVQAWFDEEIVERVLAGQPALFEVLMRRHNQRIYRMVRGVLNDDGEAEDVMQDAYVRAYQHLGQFEGRSTFVTWLTRIALHEAFARAERLRRQTSLDADEVLADMKSNLASPDNPEQNAANMELRRTLEAAILSLPPKYRTVMIVRDIEEMSTAEAAAALEISEESVKVRLHRARALVRSALYERSGTCARELFPFPATRCDRVVAAVLARI